jgi:uncharacterized protein
MPPQVPRVTLSMNRRVVHVQWLEGLPEFKYHPDPVRTGAVVPSSTECVCCHRTRGCIYAAGVYAAEDLTDRLCPWCIADGSAASRFGASFSDDWSLRKAALSPEVIDEVTLRTPGYISWQSEAWLSHCNDVCAYHGDASEADLAEASEATRLAWQREYGLTDVEWDDLREGYAPRGDRAFYKFVCRHCAAVLLGWDCS